MLADSVMEASSTTGTGSYTLTGAVGASRTFAQDFSDGDTVTYFVSNLDKTKWEMVTGVLTIGPPRTLTRATIRKSSNAGAAIDWQVGDVYYVFTIASADILGGMAKGNRASSRPWWVRMGAWLKSSTPASGYDQLNHYDGTSDIPVGVVNTTSHDVTLYGIPRGYIDGLVTSRNSGTPTTKLDIAAGECLDSTNAVRIRLSSALTKRTGGAWAAGNDANGMGNALTIANSTWYYVFAVIVNGVHDVYFDTSVSAANKPSGTSYYRLIGFFRTNGSAEILDFVQMGDYWQWAAPVSDVGATNPGTSAVTRTLTVPTGVNVMANVILGLQNNGAGGNALALLSDLAIPDAAVGVSGAQTAYAANSSANVAVDHTPVSVRTNTSAQIRSRLSYSDANVILYIVTYGWTWARGRNS